ncbi:ShlB/FhaC/HecB family hemolysin secretion/activation protein [Hydrogenophaga sp. PAMC20947]|uniref:ShlB/FhaC/HecB family hemolysin secretion/activation protein n=1 Tax=Hydrogenophaga sp. PAMC20947 TaxID=2565558 RepID=UPI00109E0E99|nr:ShlB/FhaC/HecB family hemolysin secretion/activation protein [Hydrogenophaga sp. PAMC20947]QCB45383.1 ShlB/FhaC/HecB family hemolysin secretion/activation protein [Hydrogenophaga sp. PAMC20947]
MSHEPQQRTDVKGNVMRCQFNRAAICVVWGWFAMLPLATRAQAVPPSQAPQIDPAALQRNDADRRRYLEQQPQAQPPGPVLVDEQPVAAPEQGSQVRFILKELRFDPSFFLTQEQLASVAAKYVGTEINYGGLSAIVDDINALYRERAILTGRAILQSQQITQGVVKISLVEGRLGTVTVEGNKRLSTAYAVNWLQAEPAKVLDTAALQERIELFNLSDRSRMEARLRPGADFGMTDILLELSEPPLVPLRVFADNEGAESVGREQVGFETGLNGLLGIDDRILLNATHSKGSTPISMSYSIPLNQSGGRGTLSHSDIKTSVIAGPYRALDITGQSKTTQLTISQPLAKHDIWRYDGAVSVGHTSASNLISGEVLSNTNIDNLTLGLNAIGRDPNRTLAAGLNTTLVSFASLGQARHSASATQLSGTWLERIGANGYSILRSTVQYSTANVLPSTMLLQLGGTTSVRGYTSGAVSGTDGYFLNAEYHHALNASVSGILFVDSGNVRSAGVASQRLSSAGFGLDCQLAKGVSLNWMAARALKTVLPDQVNWQTTARISWEIL